ncbi:MAG: ArsR/SmtB family transcription factor [Acidimicrobiia bacterium]
MPCTATLDLVALARAGVALADPTRRHILARLAEGPAYPGDLAAELDAAPAKVSNHLACLRGCGLVSATPDGRRVRYQLATPALALALRQLAEAVVELGPCPSHLWPRQ